MPKVQMNRKRQTRAIPLPKNQRYFDKIYSKYEVYDVSKIEGPEGTLSIYEVMQRLAAKHGGEDWSNNKFSKLWHFRHERVLIDGKKRSRVLQSFLIDDAFDYEVDWRMRCQPDTSKRTIAMRVAASVFKAARIELMEGLRPGGHLTLVAEAYTGAVFPANKFRKDMIRNYWCRIVETGTLPPEALKDVQDFDSDAEGSIIYLFITEASFNGRQTMALKAQARATIDPELRDWLVKHIAGLYSRLAAAFPQPEGKTPTFPPTFSGCLDFARRLTFAKNGLEHSEDVDPFHHMTFRNRVWSKSEPHLPRNEKWRISKEREKVLESWFVKYIELLILDIDQEPDSLLDDLFANPKAVKLPKP